MLRKEIEGRRKVEKQLEAYQKSEPGVGSKDRKPAKETQEEEEEEAPLKYHILQSIKSAQASG